MAKKVDEMERCKFVVSNINDNVRFGFGDIFHYNKAIELYTIFADGGAIVQRDATLVYFPENRKAKNVS
jgi:hypothetical protein